MTREDFIKTYAHLPLDKRKKICLTIKWEGNAEPVSWMAAYLEIRNRTKLGDEMLKKLKKKGE